MQKNSDITQIINEIAEEINLVLESRNKGRYFQEIVLLYSFIENLLKWLVWIKLMWEKEEPLTVDTMLKLRSFCRKLNFYNALNIGFSIDLIDLDLYKRIDAIRDERNNVVHQLWLYRHRNKMSVLRKQLEKLARVSNQLVEIFNQLTGEIGIEEVYRMFL